VGGWVVSHERRRKPAAEIPDEGASRASSGTAVPAERVVVLPHLELAARFDGCVDQLVTMSGDQETPQMQEHYVDLMVGLSSAATAMRAVITDDPEAAVSNLRAAIEHLQRVDTTGMAFPAGSAWRADFP
jgi:hypothetical protein